MSPLSSPMVRPLSQETQKHYQQLFPLLRRFYMDGSGQLYGVQLRAAGDGMQRLVLLRLNPKNKKREMVAGARLQFLERESELFLFEAHHGEKFPMRTKPPSSKGIGFFRVLMNEAIVIAKKKGMQRIALQAGPLRLRQYYLSHGFKRKKKPDSRGLQRLVHSIHPAPKRRTK